MSDVVSESRIVVLMVKDMTLARVSASYVLDAAELKVSEAGSADEAVAVLQARPDIQVVVTDVELPGSMNGIELANVIRERWPGIGIIITSGRELPAIGDLLDNLPKGVPFLAKPHSPAVVARLIRQMAVS
jgi:CheY-like chemotaxis protein